MSYNIDRKWDARHLALFVMAIGVTPVIVGSARAASPVADEIDRVTVVNQALLDVCSARMAREQWKLEKLELLRNRGHASWREVARQQVVVETVEAQRHAADQFAAYLAALRRRVERNGDQQEDHQPSTRAADFTPPIKLSQPGSVRLVAWFEADRMPARVTAGHEVLVDPPAPAVDESTSEFDMAKQQMADAEARVRGLTQIADRPGIANELTRAKLDLAVAAAEFAWHKTQLQRQDARPERGPLRQPTPRTNEQTDREDPPADATPVAIAAIAADVSFVRHNSNAALRDATLRVAAAEAAAIGELRAAEIALKRKQLRRDAMLQLHAEGFASEREVDHTRDDVSTAEALVAQLADRRTRLAQSYEDLREANGNHGSAAEVRYRASSGSELPDRPAESYTDPIHTGEVPDTVLEHVWAVEHLIGLRQGRCAASARRVALDAEARMLEELRRKLAQTGLSGDSIRRELENLRLDVEDHQARSLAATERLTALRLEEARFVRQFLAQLNGGATGPTEAEAPPFQSIRVVAADGAKARGNFQFVALTVPADRHTGGRPRRNYLESPATVEDLAICDRLELTFQIPASCVWYSRYRSRYPVSISGRIDCADHGPQLSSRCARQRVRDGPRFDGPTLASINDLRRDCLRIRNPSYYDFYAFGKRRSDRNPPRLRDWSYGTPPWYLPGYPTNFR
jgi:hypothetical protein